MTYWFPLVFPVLEHFISHKTKGSIDNYKSTSQSHSNYLWLFRSLLVLTLCISENWNYPQAPEEAQAGIKIAGRIINNLRYPDDTTLMAESEEELKSLLMKVKEKSKKADLKLNIQKTKIIASGPITSCQIDGDTMETVRDFISWAPKLLQIVMAAVKLKDPCSLEEKL